MPIVDGSISSIHIPSGKHTNPIENGPIEIVDFPINSMVMFQHCSSSLSDSLPWFRGIIEKFKP